MYNSLCSPHQNISNTWCLGVLYKQSSGHGPILVFFNFTTKYELHDKFDKETAKFKYTCMYII